MIVNYSGQPFEPVYDMHIRTGSHYILYEEIKTIRIIGKGDDYKLASIPYGILKTTCDNSKDLFNLRRRLNEEYALKVRFEISNEKDDNVAQYLPKQKTEVNRTFRLMRYPRVTPDVTLVSPNEYNNLKDVTITVNNGLYLCRYDDSRYPIKIQLIAESQNSLSLIQMLYSLKPNIIWKFAIIDFRLEREQYICDEQIHAVRGGRTDDKLSQKEIDERIAEILKGEI